MERMRDREEIECNASRIAIPQEVSKVKMKLLWVEDPDFEVTDEMKETEQEWNDLQEAIRKDPCSYGQCNCPRLSTNGGETSAPACQW